MYRKARASSGPFIWITRREFDHHMDKMLIEGNLARNVSTSRGDFIHVAIPSDREESPVVTGQGPTSFPLMCGVASATVEDCNCGLIRLVLPPFISCCAVNFCKGIRNMGGKSSPGKEIDDGEIKCGSSTTMGVDRNVDVSISESIRVMRNINNMTLKDTVFPLPSTKSVLDKAQKNIYSNNDSLRCATVANVNRPEPELQDYMLNFIIVP